MARTAAATRDWYPGGSLCSLGPAGAVAAGPEEVPGDFDGLFVGVRDEGAEQVAEVLRSRLEAFVIGGVDIDLLEPLGGVGECAEVHVGVAMLSGPDGAFGAAGAGEPDVGPGRLHRHHPGVDHAVLVVLAFPAEWAGLCPTLDD